jgi:hypothetical protein
MPRFFQVVPSPYIFWPKFWMHISLVPHTLHVISTNLSSFYHPINMSNTIQIMKHPILHIYPPSWHFLCLSQSLLLRHPHYTLMRLCLLPCSFSIKAAVDVLYAEQLRGTSHYSYGCVCSSPRVSLPSSTWGRRFPLETWGKYEFSR